MKKKLSLLLAGVLSLSMLLSACGGNGGGQNAGTPETPSQGGEPPVQESVAPVTGVSDETLKVSLSSEPVALYPQYSETKCNAAVEMCMFDTLVYWDTESKTISPRLATDWEWIDDTHIRFTLREGVKDVNGNEITANDVVYTFQVGTKYNNATAYTRIFDVDNFVVEDDYNIVMATKMAYPTLLEIIGNDMYCILSQSAVEAVGGEEAAVRNPLIGTGKYQFKEWVDGQYITVERNDDYWDQDALPYYKYITFTFLNDTATRAMSVESGDVDVASEIIATQVDGLKANSALDVQIFNTSTNRTFYMNCSSGPLADEKVREAIFYLLNPAAVRTVANGGYGELSETNFSQYSNVYAAPGSDYVREVNVEKAKALLTEAGYPDGFELKFMTVPTSQVVAEVVQANLLEGGIKLKIELLEVGTYISALFQGDYETYIGSADNWDSAKMLAAVDGRMPPAAAMGGAQYNDPELEALCDKAYYEFDDAARLQAYADVQQYVRDHNVCLGLCNETRIECLRAGLTGLKLDMRGYAIYADVRPAA